MHVFVFRFRLAASGAIDGGQHIEPGTPFTVRLKVYPEAKSRFIDFGRSTRCYPGFTHELLSLISENQAIAINPLIELACTLEQRVLYLEKIGEICIGFHLDIQIKGRGFVICDLEVFVKSSANRALPHNRHWSIHVNGAGSGNEEELR